MSGPRIGELFAGYGGLGMGVKAVLGGDVAWVSDIDKGACKVLAHRFPGVPNLGDITTVDWSQVEPVDVMCGGFPCQPVSKVGRRRGGNDERWLWDDIARAVGELRPSIVLLENVPGLLTVGGGRPFGAVLGGLARLGYDAQWSCLRAADIGAPHERERVFIVAVPSDSHGLPAGSSDPRMGGGARGQRRFGQADHRHAGRGTSLPTHRPADTGVDSWREYAPLIARWEAVTGRVAPSLHDDLTVITEWLMGLPAGWVTDVPGLTRSQQLKALGNGVVPAQAEAALRYLLTVTEVAA